MPPTGVGCTSCGTGGDRPRLAPDLTDRQGPQATAGGRGVVDVPGGLEVGEHRLAMAEGSAPRRSRIAGQWRDRRPGAVRLWRSTPIRPILRGAAGGSATRPILAAGTAPVHRWVRDSERRHRVLPGRHVVPGLRADARGRAADRGSPAAPLRAEPDPAGPADPVREPRQPPGGLVHLHPVVPGRDARVRDRGRGLGGRDRGALLLGRLPGALARAGRCSSRWRPTRPRSCSGGLSSPSGPTCSGDRPESSRVATRHRKHRSIPGRLHDDRLWRSTGQGHSVSVDTSGA